MWAEEGDILNNAFVDRNGVAVRLNIALDYMFSQTASAAPSGENIPNSFQGKPFLNLWASSFFFPMQ